MTQPELTYAIIIEPLSPSDGGGFLARVPELPGCYTDGDTPEAALASARSAILEWIEEARRLGREPPPPRSYALTG
ncbi:MAG TPA: type II toxin-antitoxin system HicB family antitoxin [Methylocystis sp.]|nr:type II toxin-antitoxin system HicB family antitoxin [Methylocystis sp.]